MTQILFGNVFGIFPIILPFLRILKIWKHEGAIVSSGIRVLVQYGCSNTQPTRPPFQDLPFIFKRIIFTNELKTRSNADPFFNTTSGSDCYCGCFGDSNTFSQHSDYVTGHNLKFGSSSSEEGRPVKPAVRLVVIRVIIVHFSSIGLHFLSDIIMHTCYIFVR